MRRVAVFVLPVLLLAACGGGDEPTASAVVPSAAATSSPALPSCSALFVDGQVVTAAQAANPLCLDPAGTTVVSGTFRCSDGSQLGTVDASSGAPAGWFQSGKPFRAVKEAAADSAYSKAYSACTG